MPDTQRIILLSRTSTYRSRPFIEAAKRLEIEVIQGVDMDPTLVDYWRVPLGVQFNDPEKAVQQIVAFAEKKPVRAIISLDDSASVIAAEASQALGLPHNSRQSALVARDKYEMRKALTEGGARCPEFRLFQTGDDPASIAATLTYPVVIKPLLLSGSRGVIRTNNPAEFQQAFKRVSCMLVSSGTDHILVETYLPGVEVALEGLMDQGDLTVLALFDKPDPLEGPYFEETIYVTPSRLPAEVQQAITDCTAQAVKALGLYHGPIHAELRVNADGPWILEVAGRSIGGLCSETLQFGTDMSLEELILRQAVGLDIESYDRQGKAEGVMMIPIPEGGILKGVTGCKAAESIPLIRRVEITAPLNYELVPLPEGDSYLGFIFASGLSPYDVEMALRQAHAELKFQIEPLLKLLH